MDQKPENKIVKYKKKRQFNFIVVVFLFIFIYLLSQIYSWTTHESIQMFTIGAAQESSVLHEYRGVITRNEQLVMTKETGYVNYHVREGQKVGVGATVYSTDETGEFSLMLAKTFTDGTFLSDTAIAGMKQMLTSMNTGSDSSDFWTAYAEKTELDATVMDSFLYTAMNQLNADQTANSLARVTAEQSGYILFRSDSLDGLTPEQVTADTFDETGVKTTVYTGGSQRPANSFAYKLIPDDAFSITFMITQEDLQRYQGKKYLTIELISLGVTVNGSFSTFTSSDGIPMATITVSKYGSQYLTSRFLDFKITDSAVTGFKIPVTSVTSKDFLVVPREFIDKGGETGNTYGVIRELSGYGKEESEFIPVSIYAETDTYYYITGDGLSVGDYLIQPDTTNRFLVSITAPLQGVYNINRGYCIFRQVEILSTTADGNYYIVDTQTRFGLSPYDRIVLNAELVVENQIIN